MARRDVAAGLGAVLMFVGVKKTALADVVQFPPAVSRSPKRVALLVAGYALLAGGAALLVLPGPGVPLILGGLALVGREQEWARRMHRRIRERATRVLRRFRPDPA